MTAADETYPEPEHLKVASRQELVGAIMVRAQVIEEIMREMIAEVSSEYDHPRDVLPGKTFGKVKDLFKTTFKDRDDVFEDLARASGQTRIDMFELLDSVNTSRNDAAHHHFLIALWLEDIMEGYPDDVSRFATKGIRKDAEGCDWVLHLMLALRANFFQENRLFSLEEESTSAD